MCNLKAKEVAHVNPNLDPKRVDSTLAHFPRNTKAIGSFHAHPWPEYGEVHDIYSGHVARKTRHKYTANRVFTSVVAACCTGFMQWNDVHAHHPFRQHLADEVRRLLRLLPPSTHTLSEVGWLELLLEAACTVYFNPGFLPPAQTDAQFRQLGLTLPLDGTADTELDVRLFGKKIVTSMLHALAQQRLQELRAQLASEPGFCELRYY